MAEPVRAVQVVPTAVERLPLHRWRPGARLLAVGSRDGASFADDADGRADARTFQRTLSADLLIAAQRQARTQGLAATWSRSLGQLAGMRLLAQARQGALVVATAGHGDGGLLDELLPVVDAWLLLAAPTPGPLAGRILDGGRHVEALLGWRLGQQLPNLPWHRARAAHLVPLRAGDDPAPWHGGVRACLPAEVPLYDEHHRHSMCACGATLVWRMAARSRRDALRDDGRCSGCGAWAGFSLA